MFVLFTLIVIVKGAFWPIVARPVIMGAVTVFSALQSEELGLDHLDFKNWLPFLNK